MLQKRVTRFTILALLLASGIVVAFFAWDSQRRIQSIEAEREAVENTTARLFGALASISAVQQAYVDYGQRDDASFARVSGLVREMTADAAELRPSARDAASAAAREELSAALAQLADADLQAANSLLAGESLAAADALFDAARAPVGIMGDRLRAIQAAESVRLTSERAALARNTWIALGAVALVWVVGMIVLAPAAAPPVHAGAVTFVTPEPVTPEPEPRPQHAPLELAAAAALCAEISRLNDAAALPDLLGRAAAILDARGLVVWMGAGDELFAAAAYGYDPATMSRMRPIARRADNATAAAWRTGEMRTVAAEGPGHGAIVAPMSGLVGTFGVVAAEVRSGREDDIATRAVTSIIASQLGSVLSAWPAASAADNTTSPAQAAADPGSDRQAAAS